MTIRLTLEHLAGHPTGASSTIATHDLHEELLRLASRQFVGVPPPACLPVVMTGQYGLCPIPRPDLAAAMLPLINQHRQGIGLNALDSDPRLVSCEDWKMKNCGGYLYLDHDDDVPVRPWYQRFADYYPVNAAFGENIAYGFLDAASVMQAFLSDQGHRANVENASWKAVGLAVAQTAASSSQPGLLFWGQAFGSLPVNPIPPPPPPGGTMLSQWAAGELQTILSDQHVRNWSKATASGAVSAGGKDLAAIQRFCADPSQQVSCTTKLGQGLLATAKRLAAAS